MKFENWHLLYESRLIGFLACSGACNGSNNNRGCRSGVLAS